MYDLMNEPMGAPNTAMLFLVYDRVIRAIRQVDPDKILIVEDGYKGFETTPHPNLAGWSNVCFSLHMYDFGAKIPEEHLKSLSSDKPKILELQGYRDAPMYIGEFNLEPNGGPDVTHRFVESLTGAGWSWAIWTWKGDPAHGGLGQWGVMRRKGEAHPINPFTDSESQMIASIRAARTENCEETPGILEALGSPD
jgi:hypothetical protein